MNIYKKILVGVVSIALLLSSSLAYALTSNSHAASLTAASSQGFSITDGAQSGLDLTQPLSLSLWVNFASKPAATVPLIIKRVAAGNQRSYSLYTSGSSNTLNWDTQSDGFAASCSVNVSWNPSTGTWYHVAMTQSGTTLKFYVNGSQQGTDQTCTSTTIFNGTAPFEIGQWAEPPVYDDGKIDDVRVWSRALSATEISNLYSSPCTFSNGANIISQWLFDNDSNDSVGSNNLTNNNSTPYVTTSAYTCASALDSSYFFWFE